MLFDLDPTYLYAWAIVLLLCPVAWYVVLRILYDIRIRKIGGVRAPSVGTNPFSGARRLGAILMAQANADLLGYFNTLFENAPPECPYCVEIQVSPNERLILTQDSEHMKTILTTKFNEFGKGPAFRRLWRPFLGESIFTTDNSQWRDSRSRIRPMFIKERVSDLATFEKWTSALIEKLPPSGQTVDMLHLFYRMTLDVTTDFLLGASVNSLANPKNEFDHAFDSVQWFHAILTYLGPLHHLVPRWRYNQWIKTINEFVMPYIERALSLPPDEVKDYSASDKHFTFLHSILQQTRNPTVLRDEIVAILLAGRDTTAVTLSWTLYQLCRHPEKYQKLRQEVLDCVDRDRTPTYEDLKNMTYMRYTLNETLRLYPVVPFNVRTALKDTTLPGLPGQPPISVVEGDNIIFSPLAMQRRKDMYPPVSEDFADPEVFSPERWEKWTPKPWQYLPFNGGPRICIGQNFALTEMAYFMTRITQKYERIEYRGDWDAQKIKAEIVGTPFKGVPIALFEEDPNHRK